MKKVIIAAVAVLIVVVSLIVLRPGKINSQNDLLLNKTEQKDDIVKMVEEVDLKKEKGSNPSAEVSGDNKNEKVLPENQGDDSLKESYSQHGTNIFIKPNMKVTKGKTPEKIATVDADFEKPLDITFFGLKKIFMYHHIMGHYPEKIASGFNGIAAKIVGTIMPLETVPENGEMKRFWLANPKVVMSGCVFCNPPTLADIIYVYHPDNAQKMFQIDREKLYKQITMVEMTGRFFIIPGNVTGTEYLFSLELDNYKILN